LVEKTRSTSDLSAKERWGNEHPRIQNASCPLKSRPARVVSQDRARPHSADLRLQKSLTWATGHSTALTRLERSERGSRRQRITSLVRARSYRPQRIRNIGKILSIRTSRLRLRLCGGQKGSEETRKSPRRVPRGGNGTLSCRLAHLEDWAIGSADLQWKEQPHQEVRRSR